MISWFVNHLVCYIETAIVDVFNFVIVAIAAFVNAVVGLLPNMPTLPTPPSQMTQGLTWVEYWLPVQWILTTMVTFLGLWLSWMILAPALRWAKGIRGNQ